jgi:DNA repair exonuclease SbcCD nuclease subunit
MSKAIILGDMHIGARNASPILCDFQLKFFEDQLFPYMEKHGITEILQLGDMFDSRKFSNHIVLHQWKERFFDVMSRRGISMITLLGNHDIASRNSLKVNSPRLFLSDYTNVTIVNRPKTLALAGTSVLIVPWVCIENEEAVKTIVESTDAVFCAGHFEFDGFEMQKGVAAHGGTSIKDYDKFDIVFSGHYHTRSKKKNVLYTGVPYEMTWADFNDPKGFHVFDSKTHKVSFIKTEKTLFQRIEYNDKDNTPVQPSNVEGTYIKVVVVNKTNPYEFEKFINNIVLQSPADLKITDIEVDFDSIDVDEELELEDTKTLIGKFIEQVETDLDKDKLTEMMQSLYIQALEVTD